MKPVFISNTQYQTLFVFDLNLFLKNVNILKQHTTQQPLIDPNQWPSTSQHIMDTGEQQLRMAQRPREQIQHLQNAGMGYYGEGNVGGNFVDSTGTLMSTSGFGYASKFKFV